MNISNIIFSEGKMFLVGLSLLALPTAQAIELDFSFSNPKHVEAGGAVLDYEAPDYDPGLKDSTRGFFARVNGEPKWERADVGDKWGVRLENKARFIVTPPKSDPTALCLTKDLNVGVKFRMDAMTGETSVIVGRWVSGKKTDEQSWVLEVADGQKLRARYVLDNMEPVVLDGPEIQQGKWYDAHFAFRTLADGSGTGELFLEGKLVASQKHTGPVRLNPSIDVPHPGREEGFTPELMIGSDRNLTQCFTGTIESLKISGE